MAQYVNGDGLDDSLFADASASQGVSPSQSIIYANGDGIDDSLFADEQPAPRPQYTDEQRAFEQARRRRNATAKPSDEMGSPFWAGVEGALVETPIAAAKGAFSAAKQGVEGLVVSPATGIVRLAGTPVRALTGWDGLHRLADNIDEGYRNWGADALDQGYEDWGTALGDWGAKVAGVAGSVGGLALGGGAAKVASKLGNAGKYVAAAGKAYHAAMPWMFGNNAAVRTYDSAIRSAEDRGETPNKAKALGLAAVNGAIHFLGFKLFENQSLNKMLGMPQTLEASMPAWANAAKDAGASTFSGLASGVRNGMFKYILAERAKGALKAGGIMGLQNFLSSIPQQVAEGGDVDWGRAAQEGLSGIGEGALMEGLMGGAAAWRSPKAARDFIADVYFRRGYKLPNGEVVPGLLHTPEGREFIMKQNPEAQRRILDIVEHGGEVTPAELDAACLPPMDKAELKKFADDWMEDLKPQIEEAWNAGQPPRRRSPDAAEVQMGFANAEENARRSGGFLSADEAAAQQRGLNDAAERGKVEAREQEREQARFDEQKTANDEQERYNAEMRAREERKAQAGQDAYNRMLERLEGEYPRAEAATEAPESRGAPEAGNVPPEVPSAPEAAESRPTEAAPVAEPPVIERANRLRRNLKPNFRHEGDPDNRLRPQPKENANETGNRPDEAQPQPPVQDAGRGEETGAPEPGPRPPRTEPPQGEAARPVEAPAQGGEATRQEEVAQKPKKPVNLYTDDENVARAYSDMVDAHYNQKNFSGSDIAINRVLRNSYEYAKEKLKGLLKNASTEDLVETFNGTVGGRPPTARKGWIDFFGDDMSNLGSMLKSELESRGHTYNRKTGDMDAPKQSNKLRPAEPKPVAEPPKNAPASAPKGEGTTTPPKTENAPQGGESAPDGATPKQDNKLRYATPKTEPKPAAKATDADRKAFDKEYSGKDKRNKTIRDNATDEEVRRIADLLRRSDDMLNEDGSLKDPSREGEFDAVLDEIDSVTDAILERAKKPKADNKLKPAAQGKQADARQPAQEPETPVQAPVQTAKQAQKTPMQAKQSAQAAKEAKPESAQAEQEPVQATTRKAPKLRTQAEADAESEAAQAEKQRLHDEKIRGNRVQKAVEEVKAGNIDEMTMDELKTLYEDDGWHKNLGEGAEAARAAVRSAYERRYLGNKRSGKYPSVIKALDWLERRPDNALAIAKAHDALSKSLEKAKYNGDSFGEDLLTRHLVSLNDRIANMPADMKNKVVKELGKIASKFTPMERKGRQSLDTGEGGTMDVEDKRGEASIREHAALGEVDAENASRQQALADYEGRNDAGNKEESSRLGRVERSDDDATNTSVGPSRGGTGTGGSLSGKRKFQIVERDGDDVTVAMRLPGKGIVSRKMKIDQLRALGEADPDIKRVIDELERGDEIRASKVSASDFPQGVPAKWSAAAKKSVEGAWRIARNFITHGLLNGSTKVKFEDRPPTEEEVRANERASIGGIYTGTAADYANRSRQGGKDDGPSLKKIGTGEGSQVYGWGLYGSTEKGVAENYANSQYEPGVEINGRRITDVPGTGFAAHTLEYYGNDISKSLAELDDSIRGLSPKSELAKELISARKLIADNRHDIKSSINKPTVYEQTFFTNRVPGDESHLLKWYEPVSEEQRKWIADELVKEGWQRTRDTVRTVYGQEYDPYHKGENEKDYENKIHLFKGAKASELYRDLSELLGTPQAASEFLARAGIDGVKYPVDSYGGKSVKDGDVAGWNYVSFRDDNIRVDHKWVDGKMRYFRNRDGAVVGKWDRAKNEVTLYPGADASTVAHELGGHGAWQFAEQEAKAGRGGLLERLNGVVDAENAVTKEAWDYVKKHYSDAPEAVQREEVLARIIGRKGGEAIDRTVKTLEGKAWYNRAWQTIKDAIRGMMARMGFNRADLSQIDKMTPDETMDWLVKQMTEGKTLGRVERENEVDNAPKQAQEDSSVVWDDGGARESRAPAAAGTPIMDEKRTTGEKAREKFLDSNAPYKDLQDEVGGVKEVVRADGYTDHRTSTDFVAAKDKYNGRIEHEMRGLQRRVDEVKADLNAARLDTQKSKAGSEELLKDFNLFLAAEHAAERNRTHALEHGEKPDPDYYHGMGKVEYGGAETGFSERLADQIRNDLRAKYGAKFSHFEDAAKKAYKIAADELKRRLDGDLLSQADYDYYHDRVASGEWKHYVPLKTDRARLGIDDSDIPLGTKLHRNEYRKASGRGETVAELAPYTDLVLQAEQGIKKALRNELANVEANFIEHATNVRGFKDANGNSLIAEIVPGEDVATHGKNYRFVFGDGSSVVSEGSSRLAGNHPEIHLFKRGGRLYAIRYVKGKFGRGLDVAKAASGDNVESWGNGVLSNVPKFTGWMSAMRTQYSPEFTVSNWLADSLEAAQALVGRYGAWDGAAAFGKTVAAEVRNAKDVWRYLRTGELRGDVKKAIEAGLLTKGGVASEGFEGKEASIRDRLDEFRRQTEGFWRLKNPVDKAKWVAEHVKEYLGMANEFMEYSTRIGLFSALHNKGVPVQDAVKFARDATVNFNRKGTLMPLINGLYMFANASVQGAARAVQAGKESFQSLPDDGSGWGRHKVKGDLVALLVGVGAAQAVMDHFLGNDEEREKAGGKNARNRSEYDKKHNVGIPLPGGYNMPLLRFRGPYAAIPYLAQTATNVALGDAKPEDAAWALARETADQITDLVGGNGVFNDKNEVDGSLLWQSVAPSAVDPVVQLMSGKDYKGEERLRRSFDKNAPVSWNGKRNTSEAYKKTAQMLNWLTGGNSLRKGKIDIAPEDAQLVWEFIWGGLGRDISNFASTLQNVSQAAAGGKPERLSQDIPLGRRLVREYPESTGRYYDALDEYERDKTEYRKTTEMKRKAALRRARPYLTQSGNGRVDVLASEIKNLQHLERGEVLVGQKWVEPKTPRSEAQKEKYRERRLRLQAQVLKILGE